MMATTQEDQLNELQALEAIYPEEITGKCLIISIREFNTMPLN